MQISANMGCVLHYRRWVHDAKVLKHGIVFAGGELLERAGLARGVYRGAPVGKVDGIESKQLVPQ
jgi:hypothetical protein